MSFDLIHKSGLCEQGKPSNKDDGFSCYLEIGYGA